MTGSVSILGTEYAITIKNYEDDINFKEYKSSGYCSSTRKIIVLCDMSTYPGWENESSDTCNNQIKQTLRHEIIHAFLNESGLSTNSNETDCWARNEEMVDWFAIQGPKIWSAWVYVGAIE